MARRAAWIRTLTCLLLLISLLSTSIASARAQTEDDANGTATGSEPSNAGAASSIAVDDGAANPDPSAPPEPGGAIDPTLPSDTTAAIDTTTGTGGTANPTDAGGAPQGPLPVEGGTQTSGGSDSGNAGGGGVAADDPVGAGATPGDATQAGETDTSAVGAEPATTKGDGVTEGTADASEDDPSASPDDAQSAEAEKPETEEKPADLLDSIVPAALATITVNTYLCTSDPGSVTPGQTPTNCAVQPAVGLSAVVDDTDVVDGIFTDEEGVASFDAPVGAKVFVEELLAEGLEPLTDGFVLIDELPAGGASLAFLNVTQEVAAGTGRLQVVSATCPTLGAGHTEWRVIGPFRVAAQDDGCKPNLMAYFTITGGVYGDDGLTVPTDRDGTWRGRLAPGTYTIFEDATGSSSGAVQVVAGDTTVVVALNYQGQPNGAVEIYRFLCNATAPSTEISVAATSGAPSAPDGSCDMAAGTVQLNDGTPFILEAGSQKMPMPLGDYTFTDLATGQQRPFSIDLGSTTRIVVVERMQAGVVDVRSLSCRNPAAGGVDPRNSHYFFWTCEPTT